MQSLVAGPLFSALDRLQDATTGKLRANAPISDAVIIVGYWRSGTTLLHEYLCLDKRFGFANTYACMNPHHFLLTDAGDSAVAAPTVKRPMDNMVVHRELPQEDEFALLSLGARSPYEALLVPTRLDEALTLADPNELSEIDRQVWRATFIKFVRGVSLSQQGKPLILKSPPHGCRVATLRELLPNARFIVIVRDPYAVFKFVVRMWRAMFALYAMHPLPPESHTRNAVLADRPRFENKLAAGLAGLPDNRVATIRYEALVADPVGEIAALYERLELGNFADVRAVIVEEAERRLHYRPHATSPDEPWRQAVTDAWKDVFAQYGYN